MECVGSLGCDSAQMAHLSRYICTDPFAEIEAVFGKCTPFLTLEAHSFMLQ